MSELRLILLRHAKSSWKDEGRADFDRRLAGRGVRDGIDFGRHLVSALPLPDRVLCSPARRTRETLAFLIPELIDPRHVEYEQALYNASALTILDLIRATPAEISTLMVIAHNPGLTDLLNMLVAGSRGAIENLPTFGAATFSLQCPFKDLDSGCARLIELLRPREEIQSDP